MPQVAADVPEPGACGGSGSGDIECDGRGLIDRVPSPMPPEKQFGVRSAQWKRLESGRLRSPAPAAPDLK